MVIGELLIGGHFLGGECDQTFSRSVLVSPYDGHVVGAAAEGGWDEVDAAIDAAHQAFQNWRSSPRWERIQLLNRIASEVQSRKDELSELLVGEIGKPIGWAQAEVERLAITFEDTAHLLSSFGLSNLPLDLDSRGEGHRCTVERFPLGVIFCMAPYNWPYNLVAHKIAPALATGNTLVVKTSPLAPLSTMRLVRLIHEVGAKPGLVNVWNGHDKHVIPAIKDSRVKMLSFTGSARVGWMLKAEAPDKRVVLELGGDAFAIVEEDADLDWALSRIIAGAYGYAGQICISIQHALVHESVYDNVRQKLIEGTNSCRTGDPRDARTVCGPMINSAAAQRVKGLIDEAVSGGAKVIAGGKIEGAFVFPTLMEHVPNNCALAKEEAFGPVLTLTSFPNLPTAIDRVNRSQYGIQTGLFTFDVRKIDQVYRQLETGGLIVNDYPTLRFDNVPYGGVKRSGFGREGVANAMEEMTTPKTLIVRPL